MIFSKAWDATIAPGAGRWLDFSGDPDNDADTSIFKEIFTNASIGKIQRILLITREVIVYEFLWNFWGVAGSRDVSLTTYHSIMMLILITIGIQKFLTNFLSQRDRANKNFARMSCLDVGLRSPSAHIVWIESSLLLTVSGCVLQRLFCY